MLCVCCANLGATVLTLLRICGTIRYKTANNARSKQYVAQKGCAKRVENVHKNCGFPANNSWSVWIICDRIGESWRYRWHGSERTLLWKSTICNPKISWWGGTPTTHLAAAARAWRCSPCPSFTARRATIPIVHGNSRLPLGVRTAISTCSCGGGATTSSSRLRPSHRKCSTWNNRPVPLNLNPQP